MKIQAASRRIKLSIAIAASFASLVMVAPGTAHADEQGYLAALGPQLLPATSLLTLGRTICDKLRYGGSTPENVLMSFELIGWGNPQMVEAAQRELCPDTLAPAP
ncbi:MULTISPECIES: DUF732 domain-containing protein [Mycolicibacterium]|uniref:DUF732 domain-containing protein n=1 Tax=Mycolicibacterium senegalense TaxID=1796 RepID=A0A378WDI1_9MYCO|nr:MULTISPECIES: DUF732 domain-containing protein [Mycolicibacterium]MCV7336510.1 DUF732 domain-containing protein [Mycolicibacterium senegalense]MDR7291394.1 hypothetical protein [Mycolicibacterium senegalense]QZA22883.1 DUF732 domain-containing protein [Mycolicibacterium senegalense]CDP84111.1 hypothetical protein BN975_01344 [Mycolicibacterium farcinogenes]SUA32346.1 Uncharacterised protein [Mycolicibacterium senegalense]